MGHGYNIMKTILINPDNVLDGDIYKEVVRVKGILLNMNDELLLGYSYGAYQFPGGHHEGNESLEDTLKREIKEETGMDIDLTNNKPFLLLKTYYKDYYGTGKNKCNKIYYIAIKTNKLPILPKTNYTEEEIKGDFELRYVPLKDVKRVLIENAEDNELAEGIAREMIIALNYYINNIRR